MKYEYIPVPQKNRTKRIATSLFFLGLVLFAVGGVKLIGFRVIFQVASLGCFTAAIMLVGRYLMRAYGYRIADFGEGDEFLVDEITRTTCVNVCRLELSKLRAVKKFSELEKEEKGKKHYNYSPDPFSSETYILEFVESKYDEDSERVRVRILPDEKLLSLLRSYENTGEEI